ncbi:hypothetical protein QJS04_geneDACA022008 [Acorus gramineus]|uniref:Uncharacterized protein n=1 Tax=Acorus gramineus TaxID=55184 RepID=A0AAV9A1M9_ACOGR|nr:hypothetical protein QJS04_geneDACA022008 [Acorus gramineus]
MRWAIKSVSIRRFRHQCNERVADLPKKVTMEKEMLNCINWAGNPSGPEELSASRLNIACLTFSKEIGLTSGHRLSSRGAGPPTFIHGGAILNFMLMRFNLTRAKSTLHP